MIYQAIIIVFLMLSFIFVIGYATFALHYQRRVRKIRKITGTKEFVHAFTGQELGFEVEFSVRKALKFDKVDDLLAMVTVLDYTTDNIVRENIKKCIAILIDNRNKRGGEIVGPSTIKS